MHFIGIRQIEKQMIKNIGMSIYKHDRITTGHFFYATGRILHRHKTT